MKVVLMMTYYNRPYQLKKTLDSIALSVYPDFEVVIVDDASEEPISLDEYDFPVTILRIEKELKNWICPIVPYNAGLLRALEKNPDVVIIQNSECIHQGDIIQYSAYNITEDNYFSFGCFSLDEKNTFCEELIISALIEDNNKSVNGNGENGWYNHSIHRAVCFDFCAAISAKNIIKLNGYDERYCLGIAHADNDFLERIMKLGLNTQIIDYPFVVHQWHYTENAYYSDELLLKNRNLFSEIRASKEYKAKHLTTKNLEISDNNRSQTELYEDTQV